jgi:predicted  nucleic acid-binding Zn-ribbon protein
MSRPLNLYRLQLIDTKIDQADNRLKQIEVLLSENSGLLKAQALASSAEKKLTDAQKKQNLAEVKVKDQRLKIEQVEAILYSGAVKNPKEMQDMQNEVAALKRFLDTLEERFLECMLVVDEVSNQNQHAQTILKKYRAETEKQQAVLMREQEQIINERTATLDQRPDAINRIPSDDLSIYNRLRKQRAGIAVAKVENRACSACGSTLTAALYQSARSPSQIVFCESCGRILYAN